MLVVTPTTTVVRHLAGVRKESDAYCRRLSSACFRIPRYLQYIPFLQAFIVFFVVPGLEASENRFLMFEDWACNDFS